MSYCSSINELTFSDAQALYEFYCVLRTNRVLNDALAQIIPNNDVAPHDVRRFYNDAITRYYPNEATIKAEFVNKVLFRSNHAVSTFEFPVAGSRVDLCKINGSSIAYEIKTDLDNLTRLEKQLSNYCEIFDKTYIICSAGRLRKIVKQIPAECGIYIYKLSRRGSYVFNMERAAIQSDSLSSVKQLSLLWKSELSRHFAAVSDNDKASAIETIINRYSHDYINKKFKTVLKERYREKWQFLKDNHDEIFDIDYQWFYQNSVCPNLIYGT